MRRKIRPPPLKRTFRGRNLTADPAVGNVAGRTKYTWDLTPLKLDAGSRLTFYAMVKDNYSLNGQTHDWVKSAPLSYSFGVQRHSGDPAQGPQRA